MIMDSKPAGLREALQPLFAPAHVAVIGASSTPGKQGNTAIRYLKRCGFPGRISPVNPAGGEIEGLICYRSIKEVPGQVDCVLLVIPAAAVVTAIRQCAEIGVRVAIVGANGFAELGTAEGRARQVELAAVARASGMRIVGPNTNGILNASHPLSLGYNTSHGDPIFAGPVSIAAHSGALFNSVAPRLRQFGVGLSKFVPVGNEADLDMLDFLELFIADESTAVIGLIIEGLSDGERLRTLSGRARDAGKPIVALKLGRSDAGAGATIAHSSRLAGSARAYAALFRECRIATVPTIEALAGACALLTGLEHFQEKWKPVFRPKMRQTQDAGTSPSGGHPPLVCVTSTGGGGSLLADHAMDHDIPLAGGKHGEWGGRTAAAIAALPGAGPIRNPIDGGNLRDWNQVDQLFAAIEADGLRGPLLAFLHMLPRVSTDKTIADLLVRRRARTASPSIVVAPGGLRPEIEDQYAREKIPVFHDLATCFDSVRVLYDELGFAGEQAYAEPSAPTRAAPDAEAAAVLRRAAATAGQGGFLSELQSAQVLRRFGVPMVDSRPVGSGEEAVRAADAIGYPVVLKAASREVAHKHDAGLVAIGLADSEGLRRAYSRMEARIGELGLSADATQFLLQPMLSSRAELIIGTTHEAPLGHFLIVGLGGIHAELIDSVFLLPMPMTREHIRRRIADSKPGALIARLESPARSAGSILDDVVDALAALQTLVGSCGDLIKSIDVNPLLVGDARCAAVDALIVLNRKD
jgi:acyl-CoA synthetase (NDP forming)